MKSILIVDDDAEFRSHLIDILLGEGYETESVSSAKEALEKSRAQMFDVVLLDFMMPKMSGIDALQALLKQQPKAKVIMITAFASVENAVDAIKKGASDYISKPFKIPDLLMKIRQVLEEARFDEDTESLDQDKTFNALASSTRRNILMLLNETGAMRLMEISRKLEIEDHTKIAFHLRMLKESGIVAQEDGKSYTLTRVGKKTLDFIRAMNASRTPDTPLSEA